jgi:hypothetical protein
MHWSLAAAWIEKIVSLLANQIWRANFSDAMVIWLYGFMVIIYIYKNTYHLCTYIYICPIQHVHMYAPICVYIYICVCVVSIEILYHWVNVHLWLRWNNKYKCCSAITPVCLLKDFLAPSLHWRTCIQTYPTCVHKMKRPWSKLTVQGSQRSTQRNLKKHSSIKIVSEKWDSLFEIEYAHIHIIIII